MAKKSSLKKYGLIAVVIIAAILVWQHMKKGKAPAAANFATMPQMAQGITGSMPRSGCSSCGS